MWLQCLSRPFYFVIALGSGAPNAYAVANDRHIQLFLFLFYIVCLLSAQKKKAENKCCNPQKYFEQTVPVKCVEDTSQGGSTQRPLYPFPTISRSTLQITVRIKLMKPIIVINFPYQNCFCHSRFGTSVLSILRPQF